MRITKKTQVIFCILFCMLMGIDTYGQDVKSCKPVVERMANGIWKLRYGDPERFTPESFRAEQPKYEAVNNLNDQNTPPIKFDQIRCTVMSRGIVLELPLMDSEEIYGLGLSKYYFGQRGLRKELKTCSHDDRGLGAGHVPSPFYVSSSGYGVYVDTARYATFYVGTHGQITSQHTSRQHNLSTVNENDLYRTEKMQGNTKIYVDVPVTQGIDVYMFAGPRITEVLQRYNLFSGGGCLPPLWGLGLNYEGKGDHDANETLRLAKQIRNDKVPGDYYTFPVAWQSHAYSSSLDWNKKLFSNHAELIAKLVDIGIRPALWEQAYVDPASPLFAPLTDQGGNFAVWRGLVPDFGQESVRKLFGDYHKSKFIDQNVSAFKLDECDGDGGTEAFQHWQFPEHSIFPSGLDGEQMQMLLGSLYQKTMYEAFKKANKRTFGNVRASYAMASPYPFVLYSDEYDFKEYIKYNVTSAFTGTLWDPELRHADSFADYSRRLGVMTFSAKMHIDGWQVRYPIWHQPSIEKNNAGQLLSDANSYMSVVRRFGQVRMSLIPYLYTAFCKYARQGIPPVRPMICDYTDKGQFKDVYDQWMLGDSLLVAPVIDAAGGSSARTVVLPDGAWYDFWTHQRYEGNQSIRVSSGIGHIPVFVKENTILPFAMPLDCVRDTTVFDLVAVRYGGQPQPCALYEDDGISYDCVTKKLFNTVTIDKSGKLTRVGKFPNEKYRVIKVSDSLDDLKFEPIVTEEQAARNRWPNVIEVNNAADFAGLENFSIRGSWHASSVYPDQAGSNNLLDETAPAQPYAFSTDLENAPSVIIDLNKMRQIRGIEIVNRINDRAEIKVRAIPMTLYTSNDGKQWTPIWATMEPKDTWAIQFQKECSLRFLKIQVGKKTYLHLAKVKVFG